MEDVAAAMDRGGRRLDRRSEIVSMECGTPAGG